MTNTIHADVKELSFEEALRELETIVKKLESGQVSLEDSINFYTRGTELKEICDKRLKDARMKVEMLVKQADGKIELKEFSAD